MNNIETLTQDLLFFDDAYENGNPLITDTEYEKKYSELQQLEAEAGIVLPNSPTQKITYIKVPWLETVKHTSPKLSLDKVTDYNGLKKWYSQAKGTVSAEHKMDGATIVLKYSGGLLVDAITRGDGLEGDRILHNIQTVKNLPKIISFKGDLEIRGEAYIPFADFERVNEGLPVLSRYANSRALTNGTIKMLDASAVAERGLEIKIFNLEYAAGHSFSTWEEQRLFLEAQGFPLVEALECQSLEEIASYCANFDAEKRIKLPYPIDGIVLKYSNLSVREKLGQTIKFYKWGIAYKFESEEAFTTMRDIIVQIGKNGQVTPCGVVDCIKIDGVEMTRCTLHNPNFVYKNDIRVGQRCVIARANDVIPKWIKSVPMDGDNELPVWKMPSVCPSCGSPIKAVGPMAFCTGEDSCPAQVVEQIIHYCSRDAMGIEGLGESNVKLLFDEVFIKTPADLYTLTDKADEIMELEGFGDKKLDKILESIENTKSQPLSRALYALNVPYLGRTNSRNLAAKFHSIDALMSATREQLMAVDGIGDVTADNFIEFFAKPKNKILVERLKNAGVSMLENVPEVKTNLPLSGKTAVITGTLSVKRSEVEDMVRAYGGKPSGSVSKNTDYVILGPDKTGTTKHDKALELGITIISEAEFYKILEGGISNG